MIKIEMNEVAKKEFRAILKEVGVVTEGEPTFDNSLKTFTVLKVLNENNYFALTRFMEIIKERKLKGKVNQYDKGSDIWVFKLYV